MRVFNELKNDHNLEWRGNIGSLSFGTKQDSPALQAADLLAYFSYQQIYDAIKDGRNPDIPSYGSFDFELIWECGLTLLEHRVQPNDLKTMRQNFLRKHKRRLFGRARLDGWNFEIDADSHYAENARLRMPHWH